MISFRWSALFLIVVLSVFPVQAACISIQIMQHDKAIDSVLDSSMLFEQTVMDFFFETGDIITNTPVSATANGETDLMSFKKSFSEAIDSGIDYLVVITLAYNTSDSVNPEGMLLSHIQTVTWETVSVMTGKKIADGHMEPGPVAADEDNETGITGFATKVAQQIKTGMKGQ